MTPKGASEVISFRARELVPISEVEYSAQIDVDFFAILEARKALSNITKPAAPAQELQRPRVDAELHLCTTNEGPQAGTAARTGPYWASPPLKRHKAFYLGY